jgi:hypothetical protein
MTQYTESTWTVDLTMSEEECKSNLFDRPENNMWKRILCFEIYILSYVRLLWSLSQGARSSQEVEVGGALRIFLVHTFTFWGHTIMYKQNS